MNDKTKPIDVEAKADAPQGADPIGSPRGIKPTGARWERAVVAGRLAYDGHAEALEAIGYIEQLMLGHQPSAPVSAHQGGPAAFAPWLSSDAVWSILERHGPADLQQPLLVEAWREVAASPPHGGPELAPLPTLHASRTDDGGVLVEVDGLTIAVSPRGSVYWATDDDPPRTGMLLEGVGSRVSTAGTEPIDGPTLDDAAEPTATPSPTAAAEAWLKWSEATVFRLGDYSKLAFHAGWNARETSRQPTERPTGDEPGTEVGDVG